MARRHSSLGQLSPCLVTDEIQMPEGQNPPNPPQQDSPVPSLPCEQAPWQPTLGPSGTRGSEELFHEPSQTKEPPIPGPSPSSQPPEDVPTCEPEPEVAPRQSMEEPFARPATPHSIIIIDDTPIGSPPSSFPTPPPSHPVPPSSSPGQSTSHSHNDAGQEFNDL
ncbi:hypothetical protein O181_037727 [Austropuccinia psidii MF-1]|uniref:Uncharacterized protein n=1 Tax=Austropuccinia psidii MF-1 TaxID=1389203 RepID=A0A9Q3HB75_9BASI|nr:hypothetical protein [Austropuccinia psidii MF-1]